MKITIERANRQTIEQFAEQHGLEMNVVERDSGFHGTNGQFYAHFKHAETKDGCILCGEHGNGITPEKAIRDYGKKISEKTLVIDSMGKNRRTIHVPIIVSKSEDDE